MNYYYVCKLQLTANLNGSHSSVSRKEQIAEQREYKKKKAQKKVQRMKELEQEREEQKSKWQQFNNKAYSKTKKGQVMGFILAHSLVLILKAGKLRFVATFQNKTNMSILF